jgi:hypothetical protein
VAKKFSLGNEKVDKELRKPPEHLPWGYGRSRVRAMVVDPERLYVYWEVTDEAIELARAQLGPGVDSGWFNLRVYDTTGRLFDGTNEHSYFDHRIQRADRQWFFTVGRPASEAFVEIGMKSYEGDFVKMARSGRVVFPRREPVLGAEPEWLTVLPSTGEAMSDSGVAPWQISGQQSPDGTGATSGPALPMDRFEPALETVLQLHNLSWDERGLAASELGSSEFFFRGTSERRFGGASERLFMGASERMTAGASERRYRGAGERAHPPLPRPLEK